MDILSDSNSFGREYEPVFVRRNVTGKPSFKNKPFSRFKSEFTNTNFYDDCHEIYRQLLTAERRTRDIDKRLLITGNSLSQAFAEIHPILLRAGKVADALYEEAVLVPVIWQRFVDGKYALTPILRGYYTLDQIQYRPLFIPGEALETERPFMTPSERKEDDVVRAEQIASSLEVR